MPKSSIMAVEKYEDLQKGQEEYDDHQQDFYFILRSWEEKDA